MKLNFYRRNNGERGYILLVLLLSVALLSIGFLAVVQDFKFQYQRDREEELIHRGVQYSRAIRRFYKKFGRYPTKIEDLESTNNIRFLRRRYTDPLNRDPKTGKERDFKLLHLQDLRSSFSSSPGAGVTAVSDIANQQAGAPGPLSAPARMGGFGPGPIGGAQIGQSNSQPDASAADQTVSAGATESPTEQGDASTRVAPPVQPLSQQLGPNGQPQVFGGGAIVGVASLNKAKTIREFNKKDHYNQWQFVYDPTTDRPGLLMTPNQPPLQGAQPVMAPQQPQNGQSPFSNQNPGFGNNNMNNPMNNPMQPSQPPTSVSPDQQ